MKLHTKAIYYFSLYVLSISSGSGQIPFNIQEFSTEDSIISLSVGDPDTDGKDDIFITIKDHNDIYKLRNIGGNNFSIVNYLTVPEPQLIKITTLNGGDDIAYTRKNSSGVHLLFGKDQWNTEKKVGPVVGKDTIKDIQSIASIGSWYPTGSSPPLFFIQDMHGKIYCFGILISSLNNFSLVPSGVFKFNTTLGNISVMHVSNQTMVFVPDIEHGLIKVIQFGWGVPYQPDAGIEKLFDSELVKPVYTITDIDKNKVKSMFALDAGRSEVVKYTFLQNSVEFEKSVIPLDIENAEQIHLGRIDSDGFQDLIILENNRIWMINNVAGPRAGFSAKTLLAEEEKDIRNLIIRDFDGDGISDIAYSLSGSNVIKILKNEILSAVADEYLKSGCKIIPNPGSGVFKVDNSDFRIIKLSDVHGIDTGLRINSESIDMSSFPAGKYFITVKNGGIIKILSLINL